MIERRNGDTKRGRVLVRICGLALAAGVAALASGWASPASAQTKEECQQAIDKLKAAMAASKDNGKKKAAEKPMNNAVRELGEGDFDECVDWTDSGFKVLGVDPKKPVQN